MLTHVKPQGRGSSSLQVTAMQRESAAGCCQEDMWAAGILKYNMP